MDTNTTQMDTTVQSSDVWSTYTETTSERLRVTTSYDISTDTKSTLSNVTDISTIPTTIGFTGSTTLLSLDNTTYYDNYTYSNSTPALNISDEEKYSYLTFLQDQTTMAMVPAMTFLIILATVGLIGNTLVLFVYSRKFKQTSTRIFIMAIAGFDIVTNVVAIPGEIYDMFHIWDFNQPMVCKIRLFVNAFTTMVAAMVLVAVAAVRYRKICKPFRTQVSVKLSKIISVILALASLVFSVPYAIINGRQTKDTPRKGIQGYECTIDDAYVNTIWPLVNSAFFIFLFVACCVPLVVMYILIGITAWKHSRVHGTFVYSKGKKGQVTDSSNSNEASTKTTGDSSVKFTKTQKTRSFVRMKSEPSSRLPSAGSQKVGDKKTYCSDNDNGENENRKENSRNRDDDCEDEEEDVIEYLHDSTVVDTSKSVTSTRTVRSATGEKVNINLLMVRELTVKLRAVKKEAESRAVESEGDNGNNSWNEDSDEKLLTSKNKLSEDSSYKSKQIDNSEMNNVNKENKGFFNKKKHRNKSADYNLCAEIKQESSSNYCTRISKSLDDISNLASKRNPGKETDKFKAAENEDIYFRKETKSLVDREEGIHTDESESSKDEPLSEFAKAMQWVDLTYCLREEQKENENGKNEINGEEIDTNSLSKKGSFAIGRKISRDNSFLQRHRKLKDALTDTLTRARRSRKDREAAEAEGKDNNMNWALENINSESENTCNNEENDQACEEQDTKDSRIAPSNENKILKTGKVKEDVNSNESGIKIQIDTRQTKRRGIERTTCMLILISAVYILGFLPFLGIMFTKAASPGIFDSVSFSSLAAYNVFLRSFFLNSAANPIIYSLCDINFRRECFNLIKC
uniref:G-protein coupled receptors family 1 profile domain-containing protein n=1 Tax=Arion vulgaris TaxID=1028688 RepID=A0A0B6ZQS0_9EUPU